MKDTYQGFWKFLYLGYIEGKKSQDYIITCKIGLKNHVLMDLRQVGTGFERRKRKQPILAT